MVGTLLVRCHETLGLVACQFIEKLSLPAPKCGVLVLSMKEGRGEESSAKQFQQFLHDCMSLVSVYELFYS